MRTSTGRSPKMRATQRERGRRWTVYGNGGYKKNMVNLCLQPPTVNPSGFQERRLLISLGFFPPCVFFVFLFSSSPFSFVPSYIFIFVCYSSRPDYAVPTLCSWLTVCILSRSARVRTVHVCRWCVSACRLYRATSFNKQKRRGPAPFSFIKTKENIQATTPTPDKCKKRQKQESL